MWPRTLTSWKQCATKPSQFTANCKVWNWWMIVPSMIIKLPWVNDLRSTLFSDYTYGFSILHRCICYKQNINPQTKWYMVMPYFCRCSTPVKVNKSHTRLVLVFLFTAAIKAIWIYFVFCSLVTITCQKFMGNSMLFKPTCSCGSIYTHKTLEFLFYHCVYVINSYVPKHQIPGIVQGGINKQLSTSLYEQWSLDYYCIYYYNIHLKSKTIFPPI